jgi:hypothetical protein
MDRPQLDSLEDPMGDDAYRELMDEQGVVHFTDPEHQNMALGEWLRFAHFPGARVRSLIDGQLARVTGHDEKTDKVIALTESGDEIQLDYDELGFPHTYVVDHDYEPELAIQTETDERTWAQQTPGSGEHWTDLHPGSGPHPADLGM